MNARAEFNVPVTFTFSPNFSFSPQFKFDTRVDFNLNTGDFVVTPQLPHPVDFDFDVDFGDGQLPPPPPDVPNPEEPPPKPEIEPVIRGVVVTTLSVANGLNIGVLNQGDNPDVYFPDLGLVSFLIRTRYGGSAWTTDIKVKNKRQFIECPWTGGAISVRATPRAGVQFDVKAVYGQPDPLV